VKNVEFLKRKWGYLLLGLALMATIMVVCFLLFWKDSGDAYTDGLLVEYEDIKELGCYE